MKCFQFQAIHILPEAPLPCPIPQNNSRASLDTSATWASRNSPALSYMCLKSARWYYRCRNLEWCTCTISINLPLSIPNNSKGSSSNKREFNISQQAKAACPVSSETSHRGKYIKRVGQRRNLLSFRILFPFTSFK